MIEGPELIALSDFSPDEPWADETPGLVEYTIAGQIEGVVLRRIVKHPDRRGDLSVLLSAHYTPEQSAPPHVYWVTAAPGSVRAWVYHQRQSDRLAYTNGDIRVVLYDLRPDSPTLGKLNVIDVGDANRTQMTIPPFVVHGVQNRGSGAASFINMPTNAYDPAHPDKWRLPVDHPGIPYRFE